jgi:hypothetical protein
MYIFNLSHTNFILSSSLSNFIYLFCVQIPRQLWKNANQSNRLRYLQFRSSQIHDKREESRAALGLIAKEVSIMRHNVEVQEEPQLVKYCDDLQAKVCVFCICVWAGMRLTCDVECG